MRLPRLFLRVLDAGHRPVQTGDAVEMFGDRFSVGDVARRAQRISHEVICVVGTRVPRVYFSGGEPVLIRQS